MINLEAVTNFFSGEEEVEGVEDSEFIEIRKYFIYFYIFRVGRRC